jgi:hypothetical protein
MGLLFQSDDNPKGRPIALDKIKFLELNSVSRGQSPQHR